MECATCASSPGESINRGRTWPNPDRARPTRGYPDDLIMTLAPLLGGASGCHIRLDGSVTVGQECSGKVEQNGLALACCQSTAAGAFDCARMPTTTPNGWLLSDPHPNELLGDACTQFLIGSGNLISASFP
jgi:hypothetical protein